MAEEKGADEVYCTSCGEVIKKEAEVCPNCGVRNENRETTSSSHEPSNYTTSVSENWWMGVGISIAGQIILLAVALSDPFSTAAFASTIVRIPIFLLMPISIYMDSKYVRANSNWKPSIPVWIILSLFLGFITGIAYLIKRHGELGEP